MAIEYEVNGAKVREQLMGGYTLAAALTANYPQFFGERPKGRFNFRKPSPPESLPPTPDLSFDNIYTVKLSSDHKHSLAIASWKAEHFLTRDEQVLLQGPMHMDLVLASSDFSKLLVKTKTGAPMGGESLFLIDVPEDGTPVQKKPLFQDQIELTVGSMYGGSDYSPALDRFLVRTTNLGGLQLHFVIKGEVKTAFPPVSSGNENRRIWSGEAARNLVTAYDYSDTRLGIFDDDGNTIQTYETEHRVKPGTIEVKYFDEKSGIFLWTAKLDGENSNYAFFKNGNMLKTGFKNGSIGYQISEDGDRILLFGEGKDGGDLVVLHDEVLLEDNNLELLEDSMEANVDLTFIVCVLKEKTGGGYRIFYKTGERNGELLPDHYESFEYTDFLEMDDQTYHIEISVKKDGQPVLITITPTPEGQEPVDIAEESMVA